MWAISEGKMKMAELLLSRGAGVDIQDKDGCSALMLSIVTDSADAEQAKQTMLR